MNKVAIGFSTRDRVELSKQSIEPLLLPNKFDLLWSDGSNTETGRAFTLEEGRPVMSIYQNVTGGADAAIVFNLTTMLAQPGRRVGASFKGALYSYEYALDGQYDYVGLCENDALLSPDWFEPTMALFEQGAKDGLEVGAVSARCYTERILVQRDGYALMHNLGAGQVIFSRKAAELVLQNYRTGWTVENRRTFMQLSGIDLALFSAFMQQAHVTCADWQFDRILAEHGLASLALTPAKCQMIGQVPPLAEQGLTLATGEVDVLRNDKAFATYVERSRLIREGQLRLPCSRFLRADDGSFTYFPHQIEMIGGKWNEVGDWRLKWAQGFGPFAWQATDSLGCPVIEITLSGPCTILVSGGERGGRMQVIDDASGFDTTLDLVPDPNMGQVMSVQVPASISYRTVRIVALSPGVIFYGITTREPQPTVPGMSFDHTRLPLP